MKKILILSTLLLTLFAGCKYPVVQQSGKEDMAYLLFISGKDYAGKTVDVSIDNAQPFAAKVVKEKKSNMKGTRYGIATGTRMLKVSYQGNTIYQKKIFVSTQEVKQIILP